jgi:hypothetical protein
MRNYHHLPFQYLIITPAKLAKPRYTNKLPSTHLLTSGFRNNNLEPDLVRENKNEYIRLTIGVNNVSLFLPALGINTSNNI